MSVIFDESTVRETLYPFAEIRAVADIRIGILTIREKWQWLMKGDEAGSKGDLHLPAWVIPTIKNAADLKQGLIGQDDLQFHYPWHIFMHNAKAIHFDFDMITQGRTSAKIDASNSCVHPDNIFIEAGAKVHHSFLNATDGPIYIGKDAEVMEGCMIRGPFALCDHAVLKMGTKVYGGTTIGPYSVAGGEIKNSVFFGLSNKAHDGYLGDSVIGEWCNIGAGTSNSNVKNNASMVKVWSKSDHDYVEVGMKCGLMLGDYSRVAINTSFNTGSLVGICCNVFGSTIPSKFIPDFSWGNEKYRLDKALLDIANWKKMKNQLLHQQEIENLTNIFLSQNK